MLPTVPNLTAYRRIYRQASAWMPAMRNICQRHGLDPSTLRQAPPGSHILFWVEDDWLIKLFTPLFPADAPTECLVLQVLAEQSGFSVPSLRARGDLEGWPYLVLSRLPGQPLDRLWPGLLPSSREQIAASLGRLMAALHRTPTAGLQNLQIDWQAFIAGQMAICLERQRQAGATDAWLADIAGFLADLPPLYEPGFQAVLLNADLNPEHLFCEQTEAGWQITGVIDFGDAMLGHPYYEFVAPGFIFQHAPRLRRIMLQNYGISPGDLNPTLARALMAYTLLHRFANIPDWLSIMKSDPPVNLAQMQAALWEF